MSIVYNGDPDDLYFSLIFIYDLDIVATKTYHYTNFAFKIWDLYNEFLATTPTLLMRISLYDPNYFMPSQTSYSVTINFEPAPGNLTVSPTTGTALQTTFTVTLQGWFDENTPLSYRYIAYL
jgi:hypothetical protein